MKKASVALCSLLVFAFLFSLSSCSMPGSSIGGTGSGTSTASKVKVIMWGLDPTGAGTGNKQVVDEFNKAHANIELVPQMTPGSNGYDTQDLSKLTAAIASGNPPDVTWLNAPFIMEVAARGALTSLDTLIKKNNFDMSQFYEYTVKEMTFDNHVWGLPWDVDSRILFYNKDLFKKAGLDPDAPPKTWDDLLAYSKKLTITGNDGKLAQIGFIPNYGNSWLYLFSLQNGGKFLSDDGKTCLLNSKENVEALEFMVKGYDQGGGATKLNAYTGSLSNANDPFVTGRVAMIVNVNNAISTYAKFAPNLNYGVAMAPTPTGSDFKTWSGGWAWGIPKGAKHPDEAFTVLSWLTTQGIKVQTAGIEEYNKAKGAVTIPFPSANKNENAELSKLYVDTLDNKTIKSAVQFGMDALQYSISLPVSPQGQLIWSEQAQAIDNAIYHKMSAQAALGTATKNVQAELDKFWASYKSQ